MSTQVFTLFTSLSSFGSVPEPCCEKTSATWAKAAALAMIPGGTVPSGPGAERT